MESVTFVKGSGYGSRKKVKRGWGVVESKGERWATDESKFGHASLEKMGWDKTKGLGKGQQGMTDHLQVKKRAEGKGLGDGGERTSNRWVANVTGYAGVLAKLNAQYADTTPVVKQEPGVEAPELFSQMGVMYEKRLRQKDLRTYSAEDLTAIMGGVKGDATPLVGKTEELAPAAPDGLYSMFVRPSSARSVTTGWGGDLQGAAEPVVPLKQEAVKQELAPRPVDATTVKVEEPRARKRDRAASDAVKADEDSSMKESKEQRRARKAAKKAVKKAKKAKKARKAAERNSSD